MRRVKVQSIWRESVPLAAQTAHSVLVLQPNPVFPHANTLIGMFKATNQTETLFKLNLLVIKMKYIPPCVLLSYCSMSEDEQESGCDTVDSSPTSDTSGHANSPFTKGHYTADGNQNCEPRVACVAPETEPNKPKVRTVVVPPMRIQNNENTPSVSEISRNTGSYTIYVLPTPYGMM